jgi:hypothetical protein
MVKAISPTPLISPRVARLHSAGIDTPITPSFNDFPDHQRPDFSSVLISLKTAAFVKNCSFSVNDTLKVHASSAFVQLLSDPIEILQGSI